MVFCLLSLGPRLGLGRQPEQWSSIETGEKRLKGDDPRLKSS